MSKPIFIQVGGSGPYDPVAGTTDCDIPVWAGADGWVEAAGYGTLIPTAYTIKSTGGFRLVGDVFKTGDIYFFNPVGVQYQSASGSYSNGFNVSAVLSALFGRRGWVNTGLSGELVLNTNNQICRSGRTFNNGHGHALTTLSNIMAIMENPDANDTQKNAFLESLQRGAILSALNSVFNEPEYVCQAPAFTSDDPNDNDRVANAGKFVGIEIETPATPGLSVRIDSVSFWFDASATFNVYLYHSAKRTPIWSQSVTVNGMNETVVNLSDVVISYMGAGNTGGSFYLGYYQNDIGSAKAIRHACADKIENTPFEVCFIESADTGGNFNRNQIAETGLPHGLNATFTVFKDYTQTITSQSWLFDNLIGLAMDAKVIDMLLFSKRLNGDASILHNNATVALASLDNNGVAPVPDSPVMLGIKKQIMQEAQRIKSSFNKKPKAQVISAC